jgi:hypothetical protein
MLASSVNAQIKKGSIFLGGDLSGYTQKSKAETGVDYKTTGFNVSPVLGKFIKDNLVIGGNLGFSLSDMKNDLGIDNKIRGYQVGVFIRKYKNIGVGGFYIFGQAGLNAGYVIQESDAPVNGYDDALKRTSVSINANPGISFAVNKRFHLETGFSNLISLSYFNEKRDDNSPNITGYTSNGFSLSTSLSNATSSLYVGFRVLLSK